MVARRVWDADVAGSNPVTPTSAEGLRCNNSVTAGGWYWCTDRAHNPLYCGFESHLPNDGPAGAGCSAPVRRNLGSMEQLGVLAALSGRRSRVRIPLEPREVPGGISGKPRFQPGMDRTRSRGIAVPAVKLRSGGAYVGGRHPVGEIEATVEAHWTHTSDETGLPADLQMKDSALFGPVPDSERAHGAVALLDRGRLVFTQD